MSNNWFIFVFGDTHADRPPYFRIEEEVKDSKKEKEKEKKKKKKKPSLQTKFHNEAAAFVMNAIKSATIAISAGDFVGLEPQTDLFAPEPLHCLRYAFEKATKTQCIYIPGNHERISDEADDSNHLRTEFNHEAQAFAEENPHFSITDIPSYTIGPMLFLHGDQEIVGDVIEKKKWYFLIQAGSELIKVQEREYKEIAFALCKTPTIEGFLKQRIQDLKEKNKLPKNINKVHSYIFFSHTHKHFDVKIKHPEYGTIHVTNLGAMTPDRKANYQVIEYDPAKQQVVEVHPFNPCNGKGKASALIEKMRNEAARINSLTTERPEDDNEPF